MYCRNCGAELVNGVCVGCGQRGKNAAQVNGMDLKYGQFFMSCEERPVAVLGGDYVECFLQNGYLNEGFAIASNKRVYFYGENYYIGYIASGKRRIMKNDQPGSVDLKDITGTGVGKYANRKWKLASIILPILIFLLIIFFFWMTHEISEGQYYGIIEERELNGYINIARGEIILLLVMIALLIVSVSAYMMSKTSLITIQYAGGEIGLEECLYTAEEIEAFKRGIRLAQDRIVKENQNVTGDRLQQTVMAMMHSAPVQNSNRVDELFKLTDLLSKGVITQEEFEKMKKEFLNNL